VTRWWSHLQGSKRPHFSWTFWPLKIRTPCSLKISGTNHPVMGPTSQDNRDLNCTTQKSQNSQHIQSSFYLTATGCHLLSESSLTKPTQLTAHTHGTVAAGHDKWHLLDTIKTRREETRFSTWKKGALYVHCWNILCSDISWVMRYTFVITTGYCSTAVRTVFLT